MGFVYKSCTFAKTMSHIAGVAHTIEVSYISRARLPR